MSTYDKRRQVAVNQANVAAKDRAGHNARLASSRLRPFEGYASFRRSDPDVFTGTAVLFDHIVIVRSTNQSSIPFVGKSHYVPKPFDCKIKTADKDIFVSEAQAQVECGGLVVDPTMFASSIFKNERASAANDEWDKFLAMQPASDRKRKIFSRRGTKGFFAVDTRVKSRHYGCLMVSDHYLPDEKFSMDSGGWADFKRNNMSYIHSDYDLYGLIDVEQTLKALRDSGGRDKLTPGRIKDQLSGMEHFFSTQFEQFKTHINRELGVPMIQHGEQDKWKHQDDTLYVFYPDGNKYQISATADAIRDIYDYVFHQDVKP